MYTLVNFEYSSNPSQYLQITFSDKKYFWINSLNPVENNGIRMNSNPFNPTTTIRYHLQETNKVLLKIYNTLGEEVRVLVNEKQGAGVKSVVWDGRDTFGQKVSSGVYIYQLQAGEFVQNRKMVLLK